MKNFDAMHARLLRSIGPVGPIDVDAITGTIQRALSSAGLDPDAGPMRGVTDTIRQALGRAGLGAGHAAPRWDGQTIDVEAREVGAEPADDRLGVPAAPAALARPGEFAGGSFTNAAGTRHYRLYVPATYAHDKAVPVPLVVMLHGCTQSPEDFAAGTRMNLLADQHGFLVLYPAQAPNANGSKCWNWFKPRDQARDTGEPSLIAGMTREIADRYRVDARRVYVAGLSAGAAMAVILGQTYPELYAAVGAHSGLPYGAAHDVPSAFAAMGQHEAAMAGLPAGKGARRARRAAPKPVHAVPTIVFHGDQDHTVHARNGEAIVEQVWAAAGAAGPAGPVGMKDSAGTTDTAAMVDTTGTMDATGQAGLDANRQQGVSPGGRTFSRTVLANAAGRPVAEHWVLHGAGHAWAGGSEAGSYTDPSGPDASAEMVRFFLAQAVSDA